MNRISNCIKGSSFLVLLSFLVLIFYLITTMQGQEEIHTTRLLDRVEIYAQEKESPIINTTDILQFSGQNYSDVVNSKGFNLNSFTVSVWFNTSMNVTGRDQAFLINKGGFGTEEGGFNLNYGIWLDNKEKVKGGFETFSGEDYFISSRESYADGIWHNAILTFNEKLDLSKLYIDGLEIATNSTEIGILPDIVGKQPVRLGANSYTEKGKTTGNYTGQLDDIQVWDYAFTKKQVTKLFDTESKMTR